MEKDPRADEVPEAGAGERTLKALAVSVLVVLVLFGIWFQNSCGP